MHISHHAKRWVQVVLAVAILATIARLALIFREREQKLPQPKQQELPLNPEYYVAPKKLHAYDLKSARQLTQQPVWVREGYKYVYYPYNAARHRTDFHHEAGRLGPIERLQITDLVLDASPGSPDQHQIMAVFEKDGKSYAFPVGAERRGEYQLYIDEILYIQDPRQLYGFWPADVWHAIEHHEVRPGMDELQVSFALGMGVLESPARVDERVVHYPNDGHPVVVTYREGKAVNVRSADEAPVPKVQT